MRIRPTLVAAIALAVVGIACGTDTGGTGTDQTSTPAPTGSTQRPPVADQAACEIITQEDAHTAIDEPVSAGVSSQTADGEACTYTAADGAVVVTLLDPSTFDSRRASFQSAGSLTDINDLGDAAFAGGDDVYVLAGGALIRFSVQGPYDAGARSMNLAYAAMPNL